VTEVGIAPSNPSTMPGAWLTSVTSTGPGERGTEQSPASVDSGGTFNRPPMPLPDSPLSLTPLRAVCPSPPKGGEGYNLTSLTPFRGRGKCWRSQRGRGGSPPEAIPPATSRSLTLALPPSPFAATRLFPLPLKGAREGRGAIVMVVMSINEITIR
jgi:hypothetical protein